MSSGEMEPIEVQRSEVRGQTPPGRGGALAAAPGSRTRCPAPLPSGLAGAEHPKRMQLCQTPGPGASLTASPPPPHTHTHTCTMSPAFVRGAFLPIETCHRDLQFILKRSLKSMRMPVLSPAMRPVSPPPSPWTASVCPWAPVRVEGLDQRQDWRANRKLAAAPLDDRQPPPPSQLAINPPRFYKYINIYHSKVSPPLISKAPPPPPVSQGERKKRRTERHLIRSRREEGGEERGRKRARE